MLRRVVFIVLLASLFSNGALALDIHPELWKPRKEGFTKWRVIGTTPDREGDQPNQPWSEWYNFTVEIPENATAIQMTAADENGKVPRVDGVFCAYPPLYSVTDYWYMFLPSIITWGPALNISVGFRFTE